MSVERMTSFVRLRYDLLDSVASAKVNDSLKWEIGSFWLVAGRVATACLGTELVEDLAV